MTPKILIVDDEPGIRNLISAYLCNEGYELQEAADGPSAVKISQSFKPDLIILDIMLPGMDGLEVLSLIRQHADPYVIFLTAKTEETDKIVGLTLGGDDYVTKPFSPRELTARIKSALKREQRNELKIQVQDNGSGIAPEHLPHIFTRFYRVDKSRSRQSGGSGIGLTISKHLVEAHGGTIMVESPGIGFGTTFTISLPLEINKEKE